MKKYKTFIYVVPTESLSITDMCYLKFTKKLIDSLNSKYEIELEMLYFTETTIIFKYLFNIISGLINPKALKKIKIK